MDVTLYGKCRDGRFWWDLDDRCGDWVEIIDEQVFEVPDGFKVGESMAGEPAFYPSRGGLPVELGTDKKDRPYLYGMNSKPVYLVRQKKDRLRTERAEDDGTVSR